MRRNANRWPATRALLHLLLFKFSALTRRFGDLTAVDQVTLSIRQSEIFGLIGPNGADKSTLLKMLTSRSGRRSET